MRGDTDVIVEVIIMVKTVRKVNIYGEIHAPVIIKIECSIKQIQTSMFLNFQKVFVSKKIHANMEVSVKLISIEILDTAADVRKGLVGTTVN